MARERKGKRNVPFLVFLQNLLTRGGGHSYTASHFRKWCLKNYGILKKFSYNADILIPIYNPPLPFFSLEGYFMQLSKHMIGLSVVALATLGYFVLQSNTSSTSDGVRLNTGSISSVSQSDTGVETDTGKRLETVANSGTDWGMSPFGSGKPLTEGEKKPEFKKPNTEWKTRTLQLANGRWMTYEFGKGNPKEVALNKDQIGLYMTCKAPYLDPAYGNKEGYCSENRGNVSSEVEKYLLIALTDPNWSKLATVCEKNFRAVENNDTLMNARDNPDFLIFDRVFAPNFLDMDHFISIDNDSGRKVLNFSLLQATTSFISQASQYGARKGDGYINPYGDCVDRYGTEIVRNLDIVIDLYKNPIGYPH
jgi:hypothetical protein